MFLGTISVLTISLPAASSSCWAVSWVAVHEPGPGFVQAPQLQQHRIRCTVALHPLLTLKRLCFSRSTPMEKKKKKTHTQKTLLAENENAGGGSLLLATFLSLSLAPLPSPLFVFISSLQAQFEKSHADVQAVAGLSEVGAPRITIHCGVNLLKQEVERKE
jgi:hypothetical protein